MSKTSAIIRLEDDAFLVIRKSYTAICGGDQYAAAILNYYEHRHNAKAAEVDECIRTIRNFKPSQADYVIKASHQYLSEVALQNLCAIKRAGIANHFLEELGFITLVQNIKNINGQSVNHALLNVQKLNDELRRYDTFKKAGKEYQFIKKKSIPESSDGQMTDTKKTFSDGQMTVTQRSNDRHPKVKRPSPKGQMTDNKDNTNDKFVHSSMIAHEPNERTNEPFLKSIETNEPVKGEPSNEQNGNDFTGGAAAHDEPYAKLPNLFFSEKFPNFQTLQSECLKNCENTENVDFEKAFAKWSKWAAAKSVRMENWFITIQRFLNNELIERKIQKVIEKPAQAKNPKNTEGVALVEKFKFDYSNLFAGTFEEFEARVISVVNLMPIVKASGFVIDDYESELNLWIRCKDTTSEKRLIYFLSQTKQTATA